MKRIRDLYEERWELYRIKSTGEFVHIRHLPLAMDEIKYADGTTKMNAPPDIRQFTWDDLEKVVENESHK